MKEAWHTKRLLHKVRIFSHLPAFTAMFSYVHLITIYCNAARNPIRFGEILNLAYARSA